jgi:hypothetical protein
MPRHHMIDGQAVPFSQAEEDARDVEDAAGIAAMPMNKWKSDIGQLDGWMPRNLEDIIDSMGAAQKERLAQFIRDNYAAKKALRAERPGS